MGQKRGPTGETSRRIREEIPRLNQRERQGRGKILHVNTLLNKKYMKFEVGRNTRRGKLCCCGGYRIQNDMRKKIGINRKVQMGTVAFSAIGVHNLVAEKERMLKMPGIHSPIHLGITCDCLRFLRSRVEITEYDPWYRWCLHSTSRCGEHRDG